MIIELLESRRLLSLTPVGGSSVVPTPEDVRAWDVAAADNGMYIVAVGTLAPDAPAGQTPQGTYTILRYSASGQQLGEPLTMEAEFPSSKANLDVSMDADGDAVVVYSEAAGDAEAGALKVVRISKEGVAAAAFDAVAPVSGEAEALIRPAVSMDDAGGFFVAWLEARGTSPDPTVRIRAFDAAAAPRGAAFTVATGGVSQGFLGVDVAANPDGSGAVFAHYTEAGEGASIVSYGRAGASGILGAVNTVGGETQSTAPSVAVHDDDSFILGYTRESGGPLGEPQPNYAGYVQRFTAAGAAQGGEIQLGETLAGAGLDKHTYGVDLDTLPDGGLVASFAQLVANKTDAIYAQRYTAAGVADGPPVALDSSDRPLPSVPAHEMGGPTHVAAGGDGIAIATWRAQDQPLVQYRRLAAGAAILLDRGALTISGTAAADTISVTLNGGNVVATRGSTTRSFPAAQVQFISVNGFGGNDTITNDTLLPSTMSGGAGDDTLFGGDGPDRLRGEAGRDSIWGRDGNDTIYGDEGVDSLYGNGGRDRLDGGANSDHVRGNAGRDKLFGGRGNDKLSGGESADWLYGYVGDDQLAGDGGNDVLYGEAGADTLRGGAGDDLLGDTGDSAVDQLFGDRGRDTVEGDANDILTGIEVIS